MVDKRKVFSGRSILFWLLFGMGVCACLWLLHSKELAAVKVFDYSQNQAEKTYQSTVSRYRYFTLPGDSTKIASLYPFEYTTPKGIWTLVNKTHLVALDYVPPSLITAAIPRYENQDIKVRTELNEPLKAMAAAAQKDGINLFVVSGYRSSSDQQQVLGETTAGYAALPGQSEHQTGLAVDINSGSPLCGSSCSLSGSAAAWLARFAPDYGFIVRYPADKVTETGYPAESWHLRYVGVPLAQALTRTNTSFDAVYPLFAAAKERQ